MKPKGKKRITSVDAGGQARKRKLNLKKFTIAILVLLFAIYFSYIMIWQQITISKKNGEINALRERIEAANTQTQKLEAELENLNDPEYLEKIAREKLGLIRPNERVFVDANKSQSNTAD